MAYVAVSPVKEDFNTVNAARAASTSAWWLYYDYTENDEVNMANLINHSNQSKYDKRDIELQGMETWEGDAAGRNTQGYVSIKADGDWTGWQHIKWRRATLEWVRDRFGNYLWIPFGTSSKDIKKRMAEYYNINEKSVHWYIPSLSYPGNLQVWLVAKDSSTMFVGTTPFIISYW